MDGTHIMTPSLSHTPSLSSSLSHSHTLFLSQTHTPTHIHPHAGMHAPARTWREAEGLGRKGAGAPSA